MNIQHVNIKFFVESDFTIDLERLIEVFHGWVAEQSTTELLIDVADYRHVPDGPAVVLIGHEADYVLDKTDGRPGLLYNRKAACDGTNNDKLRQSVAAALQACEKLEQLFPGLSFSRTQFELRINDRALAPNEQPTYDAFQPLLEEFVTTVLGQASFTSERHNADRRKLFGLSVELDSPVQLA